MYDRIRSEILGDRFYTDNFPNEGQRFVAWYLRRVLLLDPLATKASITDGQNDKQIDAIVIEDGEDRRIRVVQGKFVRPEPIDAGPLREVLSAWTRLKDLPSLQLDASGRLAERLESLRAALEDEYEIGFELLTTGSLSAAAQTDFDAFRENMSADSALGASLELIDSEVLATRLADAERRDLPELNADLEVDPARCLVTDEAGYRAIIALLPLAQCLKLPGIPDGKLFRKNVRQSLGLTNKVNKGIRDSLADPQKRPYFFFFHNGVTATCSKFDLSADRTRVMIRNLSVVNGAQSLSTIWSTSGKVAQAKQKAGSILFRIYEIPQPDLLQTISIFTNSQSAVKPRDLRSNDKFMLTIKRRYESAIASGYFITKRGESQPADKNPDHTIDAPDYGKAVVSWVCQRPNRAYNERNIFDEYYKVIFHQELEANSILALKQWLAKIDRNWSSLHLNDAVKAVRGQARAHILFAISQLFAHFSNQPDKVPIPKATLGAMPYAELILGQAVNCMNQALQQAIIRSNTAGKVFSPQNWLKVKASVQDEQLVAGTVASLLQAMAPAEFAGVKKCLTLAPEDFLLPWSVD